MYNTVEFTPPLPPPKKIEDVIQCNASGYKWFLLNSFDIQIFFSDYENLFHRIRNRQNVKFYEILGE